MVVEGIRKERFLIMTHPATADAAVLRATDANAYLEVMSGLWSAVGGPLSSRSFSMSWARTFRARAHACEPRKPAAWVELPIMREVELGVRG
jgi:hypothetical protein